MMEQNEQYDHSTLEEPPRPKPSLHPNVQALYEIIFRRMREDPEAVIEACRIVDERKKREEQETVNDGTE